MRQRWRGTPPAGPSARGGHGRGRGTGACGSDRSLSAGQIASRRPGSLLLPRDADREAELSRREPRGLAACRLARHHQPGSGPGRGPISSLAILHFALSERLVPPAARAARVGAPSSGINSAADSRRHLARRAWQTRAFILPSCRFPQYCPSPPSADLLPSRCVRDHPASGPPRAGRRPSPGVLQRRLGPGEAATKLCSCVGGRHARRHRSTLFRAPGGSALEVERPTALRLRFSRQNARSRLELILQPRA